MLILSPPPPSKSFKPVSISEITFHKITMDKRKSSLISERRYWSILFNHTNALYRQNTAECSDAKQINWEKIQFQLLVYSLYLKIKVCGANSLYFANNFKTYATKFFECRFFFFF